MGQYTMSAGSAADILAQLTARSVEVCVGGGWAVDALLGEQTREHSDLDLWLPAAHLEPLFAAFAECGVDRVLPWPGDRPWNFALHDGVHRRVDLHLYEPLTPDRCHYGSVSEGTEFPTSALSGRGTIGGRTVRCEAPEWAVRWHSGYPLRPVDRHDVPLLCARFGLELPDLYRW